MMQMILPTTDLIGRDSDIERIAAKALETRALIVLGEPGCGTSQVLRYVCDRLSAAEGPPPYYLELDQNGFDRTMVESLRVSGSFVVLDGAHYADAAMLRSIAAGFELSGTPFIIAGWRRALFPALTYRAVRLDRLPFAETVRIVEHYAAGVGIELADTCRDLIALLIGGRPRMIASLLTAAADRTNSLQSFAAVQQIFTDEITGGRIGREMDAEFAAIIPEETKRERLISIFAAKSEVRVSDLQLSVRSAALLHAVEHINIDRRTARLNTEDHVLSAYIRSRHSGPRALVIGRAMAANVTASTSIMSRHYRTVSSLGLRDLLSRLNGERISRRAIDHGAFRESLKGLDPNSALDRLRSDEETVELPKVFYSANTEYAYPPISELVERERSALAIGTNDAGEQITIVAAEIESKLRATRETAEFWCDRLEMAAVSCGFSNSRIWLVAPEGFDDDAINVLAERNAYGSSRQQIELIKKLLEHPPDVIGVDGDVHEFVVPMGETGEMLSAKVLDDLAARYGIPPKATNQIKTALIEACINAAEHSLSPDRTIRQKFVIGDDRVTITVSNRGVRLSDKQPVAGDESTRRGWGLKLMRNLMDEVRLEQTDDGTSLVMSKQFENPAPGE